MERPGVEAELPIYTQREVSGILTDLENAAQAAKALVAQMEERGLSDHPECAFLCGAEAMAWKLMIAIHYRLGLRKTGIEVGPL